VDADNRAFADGASLTNPEGALYIERDVPARARTRSAWGSNSRAPTVRWQWSARSPLS